MIIKTRKNEEGQQLYQRIYVDRDGNRSYFEEGHLSQINFQSSSRERRIKFGNSRKATNGRIIQIASNGKRIQHESDYRLWCKKLLVEKKYGIN